MNRAQEKAEPEGEKALEKNNHRKGEDGHVGK